ncbi:MAG: pyridoxal-phosphate dependent enzyme, partial [Ginsengibacter sp.]
MNHLTKTGNAQMPVSSNGEDRNKVMDFRSASQRLKKIVNRTPLAFNQNLSKKYQCNIFLKREDLQVVRSYKLRGAYNMMSNLS